MTRILPAGVIVSLLVSFSCGHSESQQRLISSCSPSFRDVSPKSMLANYGSWQIYFNLALIGCAERLEEISPSQMDKIALDLRQSSQWSNPLFLQDSSRKASRIKVVNDVNQILGRQLVSDVMFHDIRILDHSE